MTSKLEDVVAAYRTAAVSHGAAENHRKANKAHDEVLQALARIREHGADGDIALLGLMKDSDFSVRVWAATHSLRFREAEARRVLSEVAAERAAGLVALNAEMVLQEWDRGVLDPG